MIINRIKTHIDGHIMTNKNGFRSDRTISSQILVFRRLIGGVKNNNIEATPIFIDFKKAGVTIHKG